ncbi:hypothetical protein ANACOL_02788 [Anaerotruncus colihominis DSM 17241]|uniref:Uncharacterized protein n=1 Tax=Anaerotruncus colihominis DSM 17241 TaxID=445972 RepID=B0PE03_9FIRM|nr:hypothetical protein ANACOL_02788 [Anaerotruncus colihominis DSM 17241]
MSAARHDKIGYQGGSGLCPRIALAIRNKINAFAFILSQTRIRFNMSICRLSLC